MAAILEEALPDASAPRSSQGDGSVSAVRQKSALLFGSTIFLSAFLLFFVQLLLAKRILPIFGGAPSVWTSCIMFFQILLLAGYILAHLLASRFNFLNQGNVVIALLGLSLAIGGVTAVVWPTPITPNVSSLSFLSEYPSLCIVAFLTLAIGLPFLALSTTSPLLQNWFAHSGSGTATYRLYALSNAGSLIGLLAYPFFFEPLIRLRTQAWMWSILFLLYAALYAACALRSRSAIPTQGEAMAVDTVSAEVPGERNWGRQAAWTAASFFASTLLLSTTNYVCQEIAVIPFLWVLPLSVYLLSFILTFGSERWYKRNLFHALFGSAVILVLLVTSSSDKYSYLLQLAACVLLLFAGCMVCHGEAFRLRPTPKHITRFYLFISIGGALGGVFVNLVAPSVFLGYWEFPLAILGTAGLLLTVSERDENSWLHRGKTWLAVAFVAAISLLVAAEGAQSWPQSLFFTGTRPKLIVAGLALLALALYAKDRQEKNSPASPFVRYLAALLFLLFISGSVIPIRAFYSGVVATSRNFYGVLTVVLDRKDNYLTLWHGKTAHGFQFLRADLQRLPTGYYGQHSGANILLRNWQEGPVRVGLVGMGAGTLAAMGKPGDTYRFYEINPDVLKYTTAERPLFTFMRDSPARVETVLGDGRLSLEQELKQGNGRQFDVLVLDAFSSDSIPLHLLTREAFAIYLAQLRNSDSVIAVHISNKTVDLSPVIAGIAKEFQLQAVRTHPTWMGGFSANSDWILLSRSMTELSSAEMTAASVPFPADAKPILWTDDFSNLVRVLR